MGLLSPFFFVAQLGRALNCGFKDESSNLSKNTPARRPASFAFRLGALTFKISSFNTRPWELNRVEVPDFVDHGRNLTFHLRGSSLVGITSRGWLRDRVRFSHDGYRRQRLTYPLIKGSAAGWSLALTRWWELVYDRPLRVEVDPVQPYAGWLYLLLRRLSFLSRAGSVYSVDRNLSCRVYHGSHGLEAARGAELVLPVAAPYEELGSLPRMAPSFSFFSSLVFQFFRPSPPYRFSLAGPLRTRTAGAAAVFQVSPLQRFLAG